MKSESRPGLSPGADQVGSRLRGHDPVADRSLHGLRCLVLGGTGFLGSELSRVLGRLGACVSVFSRGPSTDPNPDATWIEGDFRDPNRVADAVRSQDVVFHLVSATTPGTAPQDMILEVQSNLTPSLQLLEACRRSEVRKIVFVSSGGAVYGVPQALPISEDAATRPISAYGIGKLAIEQALALHHREHQLAYQVLRVSNPYGRGQSPFRGQGVVAAMTHRVLRGLPLEIWGDGEVVRDFINLEDVVAAMLHALHYDGPHHVMNVGSGTGLSVNQVAADIEAVLARRAGREWKPGRRADVPVNVLDIGLIKRETGWSPRVDWLEGLHDTAEWLRRRAN